MVCLGTVAARGGAPSPGRVGALPYPLVATTVHPMFQIYRHGPARQWLVVLLLAAGAVGFSVARGEGHPKPHWTQENARAAIDEARGRALTASVAGPETVRAAATDAQEYAGYVASWVDDKDARRQLRAVTSAAGAVARDPSDAARSRLRDRATQLHVAGPEHFPRIPGVAGPPTD